MNDLKRLCFPFITSCFSSVMTYMEMISQISATITGLEANGCQVALKMASIGALQIQLVDFDTVKLTNRMTQGYRRQNLGR